MGDLRVGRRQQFCAIPGALLIGAPDLSISASTLSGHCRSRGGPSPGASPLDTKRRPNVETAAPLETKRQSKKLQIKKAVSLHKFIENGSL
jgi:hypothetical protein